MTCSPSLGKLIAAPRWITLEDLELSVATKEALKKNWPFDKTDFGGGVAFITLDDLAEHREELHQIPRIGEKRIEEISRAIKRAESEIFPYRI